MRGQLKRQDFVSPDPKDPRVKMAKRLATFYRHMMRSQAGVFRQPFNTNVPIELQGIFTHFLKAADVVIEEDGDPEMFIRAQFEGLSFARSFPFPPQLHTSNARLRFCEYMNRKEKSDEMQVKEEDYVLDEFEVQEAKLKRMMGAMGMPAWKVLHGYGHQFTKAFLRSKRVAK